MHTSNQLNWNVAATKAVPSIPTRCTGYMKRSSLETCPSLIHTQYAKTYRCSYGKPTAFECNFRTAVSKGACHCVCVCVCVCMGEEWIVVGVCIVLLKRGHLSTSGKFSIKTLRLGSKKKLVQNFKLSQTANEPRNSCSFLAPLKLSHFPKNSYLDANEPLK